MLAPIEYLQWYRNQPAPDHDLGGTDLRPDHPDGTKIVPDAISDVADPSDGEGAVSILAREYDVSRQEVLRQAVEVGIESIADDRSQNHA